MKGLSEFCIAFIGVYVPRFLNGDNSLKPQEKQMDGFSN